MATTAFVPDCFASVATLKFVLKLKCAARPKHCNVGLKLYMKFDKIPTRMLGCLGVALTTKIAEGSEN